MNDDLAKLAISIVNAIDDREDLTLEISAMSNSIWVQVTPNPIGVSATMDRVQDVARQIAGWHDWRYSCCVYSHPEAAYNSGSFSARTEFLDVSVQVWAAISDADLMLRLSAPEWLPRGVFA